jgi:hypothetical protein
VSSGGVTANVDNGASNTSDEAVTISSVVLGTVVSPVDSATPTTATTATPTTAKTAAPTTATTATPPPTYPDPVAGNLTVTNLGSNSYKFGAPNSSKCQERETWTLTGPTPHSSDSGNIGWHCYPITHNTGPFTLTAGNYTITLTLYGNGKQNTSSQSFTVP